MMHKSLAFYGLCCVWALLSHAEDSSMPQALVRVALVRDSGSFDETMHLVLQQQYEGNIRILHTDSGKYLAINTLDVEDYLKGVVGREMSKNWPVEALKAQAVAARSHALYSAEQSLNAPYDLIANVSQAYNGVDGRNERIANAVEATRNQVIVFQNALVPTYFHASCGGHTASVEEVWNQETEKRSNSSPMPQAVRCPACAQTAEFRWEMDLMNSSLTQKMKSKGSKIGELVRVKILDHTPSGRVSEVEFIGTLGSEKMSAEKLRALVGYNLLRSGFFDIEKNKNGILFKGEGWGHGVGLCQYGAKRMAEQGADYRQILEYYFPGTKMVAYKPSGNTVAWHRRPGSDGSN